MKTIWILPALVLAFVASAQESNPHWVFAAGSETGADFYIDPGSVTVKEFHSQATIQVDGKYVHPSRETELVIFAISHEDCRKDIGILWMLDTSGRSMSRNDFATQVNSTASQLASRICPLGLIR